MILYKNKDPVTSALLKGKFLYRGIAILRSMDARYMGWDQNVSYA